MKRIHAYFKALLKRREWIVILVGYPIAFGLYLLIKLGFKSVADGFPAWFGGLLFLLCAILILYACYDLFNKLFKRNLQGQHLKMRKDEGITLDKSVKDDDE